MRVPDSTVFVGALKTEKIAETSSVGNRTLVYQKLEVLGGTELLSTTEFIDTTYLLKTVYYQILNKMHLAKRGKRKILPCAGHSVLQKHRIWKNYLQ